MKGWLLSVAPLAVAVAYFGATAFGGSPAVGGEHGNETTADTRSVSTICTLPVVDIAYKLTGSVFTASQASVNCASWQTFISLAWPADPDQAGQPDTSATAADFGDPTQGPSVWETYSTAPSVFRADGEPPTGFGSDLPAPDECPEGSEANAMVLSEQAKFSTPPMQSPSRRARRSLTSCSRPADKASWINRATSSTTSD